MRQTPVVSGRLQISGRPMPEWFSKSVGTNNVPPLPPLPAEPPPNDDFPEDDTIEESEYEEVDHIPMYSNANENGGLRKSGVKWICSLCGNCNPAVRCEMCNNQVFCGACNEMFHRHPKRSNHVRKILEAVQTRPPLPPKAFQQQQQQRGPPIPKHMNSSSFTHDPQQQQQLMPIPPPRRNRKFGSTSNIRSSFNASPTLTRKLSFDPMGSLKRFVKSKVQSQQQLTPKSSYPSKSKSSSNSNLQKAMHSHPSIWRNSGISPHFNAVEFGPPTIPLSVMEISNQRGINRNGNCNSNLTSRSFVNLSHNSSQDSGYRGEDDDLEFSHISNNMIMDDYIKQRSNSHGFLNRISTSSPVSHFATLQRQSKSKKPALNPPPAIPRRDFGGPSHQHPQQQQMAMRNYFAGAGAGYTMQDQYPEQGMKGQMFQSAFELRRSGDAFLPLSNLDYTNQQWQSGQMNSYPAQHQQQSLPFSNPNRMSSGSNSRSCTLGPLSSSQSDLEREMRDAYRRGSGLNTNRNEVLQEEMRGNGNNANADFMTRPKSVATFRVPTPHSLKQETNDAQDVKYNSGDFAPNRAQEPQPPAPTQKIVVTENPDGPWSCEHCTFVNPKTSKICTICCKTPLEGYRTIVTLNSPPRSNQKASNLSKTGGGYPQEQKVVQKDGSNGKQMAPTSKKQFPKSPPPPLSSSAQVSSSPSESESEAESDDESSDPEEVVQRQKYSPKRQQRAAPIASAVKPCSRQSNKREPMSNILKKKSSSTSTGTGPGNLASPGKNYKEVATSTYADFGINELSISDEDEELEEMVTEGQKRNMINFRKTEEKFSKGTSPPPQEISTQTYEQLPAVKSQHPQRFKSASKSSIPSEAMISSSSRDVSSPSPPPKVEMSAKALRYARRAQQQARLKRSASAHLTSSNTDSDPWMMDSHHPNYHQRYHRHPHSQYGHAPTDYEGRGFYRSSSRHSLASDTRSLPISGPPSRDSSPSAVARSRYFEDFRNGFSAPNNKHPSWDRFPSPGDYFASIEDLVTRKNRESIKSQEFELSHLLKEAENLNYTPEDLQVAVRMCGERNPIKWLQENWSSMIETVQTLATKYGREKGQELNDVGTISSAEAKEALRLHRGNVWAGVTECVEQRRKKFHELQARGSFLREDILTALTAHHGNIEAAYVELSKAQLKPFLMRIWGPPSGPDNETSAPRSESILSLDSSLTGTAEKFITAQPNQLELQNVHQAGKRVVVASQQILQYDQTTELPLFAQGSSSSTLIQQPNYNNTSNETSHQTQQQQRHSSNLNLEGEKLVTTSTHSPTVPNNNINQTLLNSCTSNSNSGMIKYCEDSKPQLQLHVKYEPKDERFVNAVTDYNNVTTGPFKPTLAKVPKQSASNPRNIDEELVSHFIQNFLVPEAPKQQQFPTTSQTSICTQANPGVSITKMNEPDQMKLLHHPTSESPFIPITMSSTPSSLNTTRTSSELEKLFNDPHQDLISPQHQLANLAKAMNMISEKLGVLLQKQDETQQLGTNPSQNETEPEEGNNNNDTNNVSNNPDNKTEEQNDHDQEKVVSALVGESQLPEAKGKQVKSEIKIAQVTLKEEQVNREEEMSRNQQSNNEIVGVGDKSAQSAKNNDAFQSQGGPIVSTASISTSNVNNDDDHDIQVLKDKYKDELKILREIVLNEANSNSSNKNPVGNVNVDTFPPMSKENLVQLLKHCSPKLYEALGNVAGSLLKSSTSSDMSLLQAAALEDNATDVLLLNEEIPSFDLPSAKPKPTTIKENSYEPSELTSALINLRDDNRKTANIVPLKEEATTTDQTQGQSQSQYNNGEGVVTSDMTEISLRTNKMKIAVASTEMDEDNEEEDLTDITDDEEVEEEELAFEGESGSESYGLSGNEDEFPGEVQDDEDDRNINESESEEESEGLEMEIEASNELDILHPSMMKEIVDEEYDVYEEIELTHPQQSQKQGFSIGSKPAKQVKGKPGMQRRKLLSPVKELTFNEMAMTAIAKKHTEDGEDYSASTSSSATYGADTRKKQIEKRIQQLISTGMVRSFAQGEMALKLIEMNFTEEDSTAAATECSSLYTALCFLQQECLLCAGKFSARDMVSMLQCVHRCCRTCASEYFMLKIRDNPVIDLVCPFCKEPSNLNEDPELATSDYFSQLDLILKGLLSERYYEMFQRKLRDWVLAKIPNFKWCSKCSSGFIMEPMQTRLICPDCSAVTCAICLEPWNKDNHDHKDTRKSSLNLCDEEPHSSSLKSIVDFLNENCIECPRCHLKFTLARGGCMHLTCSQCRFEFCSGCFAQFRMGSKCSENAFCQKLGLHAHHPRNCLFYLRDKEPQMLIKLLEDNNILYHKEDPVEASVVASESGQEQGDSNEIRPRKKAKCQVPIQKETEHGPQDDICGQETCPGHKTVCLVHYVEYLGLLIWQNHLDPVSLLSNDDLETIVKRAHKKLPRRPYGTKDEVYRPLLLNVIQEEIPL